MIGTSMRNSISVLYYSCLSVFKIPWKLVGGRVIYSMVYFLFGVLCWVLRVYSSTILDWISVINVCDNEERCSGTLAVYRFSFALAVRNSNSTLIFTRYFIYFWRFSPFAYKISQIGEIMYKMDFGI